MMQFNHHVTYLIAQRQQSTQNQAAEADVNAAHCLLDYIAMVTISLSRWQHRPHNFSAP